MSSEVATLQMILNLELELFLLADDWRIVIFLFRDMRNLKATPVGLKRSVRVAQFMLLFLIKITLTIEGGAPWSWMGV